MIGDVEGKTAVLDDMIDTGAPYQKEPGYYARGSASCVCLRDSCGIATGESAAVDERFV